MCLTASDYCGAARDVGSCDAGRGMGVRNRYQGAGEIDARGMVRRRGGGGGRGGGQRGVSALRASTRRWSEAWPPTSTAGPGRRSRPAKWTSAPRRTSADPWAAWASGRQPPPPAGLAAAAAVPAAVVDRVVQGGDRVGPPRGGGLSAAGAVAGSLSPCRHGSGRRRQPRPIGEGVPNGGLTGSLPACAAFLKTRARRRRHRRAQVQKRTKVQKRSYF